MEVLALQFKDWDLQVSPKYGACILGCSYRGFDILRKAKPGKNGEIQITDALKTQAKSGKVIALKYKGNRFDCGSIEGYVKATISLAKQRNIIQ